MNERKAIHCRRIALPVGVRDPERWRSLKGNFCSPGKRSGSCREIIIAGYKLSTSIHLMEWMPRVVGDIPCRMQHLRHGQELVGCKAVDGGVAADFSDPLDEPFGILDIIAAQGGPLTLRYLRSWGHRDAWG